MNHFLLIILLSALSQTFAISAVQTMCPFVGGSAVYKARTLYTILNPLAQYNDRLMCIQGQNKNGNSGYVNLDSLNEAETNIAANALALNQGVNTTTLKHKDIPLITGNFEDILLYPNPANTFINISYFNEDGIFELYDAIGKLILKENLIKQNETQKILLPKISNGIYSYRIVFTKSNYTGKINIKQDE